MSDNNSTDPAKKHWIVVLVLVPIVLAVIAIAPSVWEKMKGSDKNPATATSDPSSSSTIINNGTVTQTSGDSSVSNVIGPVTITTGVSPERSESPENPEGPENPASQNP